MCVVVEIKWDKQRGGLSVCRRFGSRVRACPFVLAFRHTSTIHHACPAWCDEGTMLKDYSPIVQALLGTLFTWALTAAGAALVVIIRGKQVSITVLFFAQTVLCFFTINFFDILIRLSIYWNSSYSRSKLNLNLNTLTFNLIEPTCPYVTFFVWSKN